MRCEQRVHDSAPGASRQARRTLEGPSLEGRELAAEGAPSYRTASHTAERFSPNRNMCNCTYFDLPARAPGAGDLGDVVGRHFQAGEEGVVVGLPGFRLVRLLAADGDFDPGADDGVGAVAHGHAALPAVAVEFDLALGVAHLEPVGGLVQGRVQEVVQALVRAGLADEDEVDFVVEKELADGVAAIQVVAEEDGAVGG